MSKPIGETELLERVGGLIAQVGGESVTMEQIACETSLSRATLYRRFGSREQLLRRAVEQSGLDTDAIPMTDAHTRILQAARVVFSRYGFTATTIEQVAEEAGVGPATVYRHFGSKMGLIEAFMQASSPRRVLRQINEAVLRPGGSRLDEDLTSFATAGLQFMYENRDLIRLGIIEQQIESGILAQLRGSRERTVTSLARYFERGMERGVVRAGDPFAMALVFVASLLSHAVIAPLLYDRPLEDVETTARRLVMWFLEGVQH